MPYDPLRKLMTPDFQPPQPQQDWIPMGEDEPIDLGPAAGAFKERFMQKPQAGPAEHGGGEMPAHIAPLAGGNPGHEALMGGGGMAGAGDMAHGMGGADMLKKPGGMKSL